MDTEKAAKWLQNHLPLLLLYDTIMSKHYISKFLCGINDTASNILNSKQEFKSGEISMLLIQFREAERFYQGGSANDLLHNRIRRAYVEKGRSIKCIF